VLHGKGKFILLGDAAPVGDACAAQRIGAELETGPRTASMSTTDARSFTYSEM